MAVESDTTDQGSSVWKAATIIGMLAAHGADLNHRVESGHTLKSYAFKHSHFQLGDSIGRLGGKD